MRPRTHPFVCAVRPGWRRGRRRRGHQVPRDREERPGSRDHRCVIPPHGGFRAPCGGAPSLRTLCTRRTRHRAGGRERLLAGLQRVRGRAQVPVGHALGRARSRTSFSLLSTSLSTFFSDSDLAPVAVFPAGSYNRTPGARQRSRSSSTPTSRRSRRTPPSRRFSHERSRRACPAFEARCPALGYRRVYSCSSTRPLCFAACQPSASRGLSAWNSSSQVCRVRCGIGQRPRAGRDLREQGSRVLKT